MPGIALHTRLAEGLMADWRAAPSRAPFDAGRPELRDAFLNGCMGPDMGYFPGGDTFVSDLSHFVRTADLARELVRAARSGVERAYAWGWFSHVLADVMIHPLVNRAAGDWITSKTFADDPPRHVAVEIGLDGYSLTRDPTPVRGFRPAFGPESIGYLERCFRRTYGDRVTARAIRRSHHACARWSGVAAKVSREAARLHGGRPAGDWFTTLVYRPARMLARGTPWSVAHGFTNPVPTSERLARELDEAVAAYPERFHEQYREGLRDWPDYNLDTGEAEGEPKYAHTVRALASLGDSGGRSAPRTGGRLHPA